MEIPTSNIDEIAYVETSSSRVATPGNHHTVVRNAAALVITGLAAVSSLAPHGANTNNTTSISQGVEIATDFMAPTAYGGFVLGQAGMQEAVALTSGVNSTEAGYGNDPEGGTAGAAKRPKPEKVIIVDDTVNINNLPGVIKQIRRLVRKSTGGWSRIRPRVFPITPSAKAALMATVVSPEGCIDNRGELNDLGAIAVSAAMPELQHGNPKVILATQVKSCQGNLGAAKTWMNNSNIEQRLVDLYFPPPATGVIGSDGTTVAQGEIYVNEGYFGQVGNHEIGHSRGLGHAGEGKKTDLSGNSINLREQNLSGLNGAIVDLTEYLENFDAYGRPGDIMGGANSGKNKEFNPVHLDYLSSRNLAKPGAVRRYDISNSGGSKRLKSKKSKQGSDYITIALQDDVGSFVSTDATHQRISPDTLVFLPVYKKGKLVSFEALLLQSSNMASVSVGSPKGITGWGTTTLTLRAGQTFAEATIGRNGLTVTNRTPPPLKPTLGDPPLPIEGM